MLPLNNLIVIIIIICLFECLAQGCLKKFFTQNNNYLFVISIVCYIIICFLLVKTYRFKSMGIINCIWSGISILFILIVGILIFDEKINIRDIFGIILVVIGIFLIEYDGPHGKELFL